MSRFASILVRALLTGAFLAPFLGWLGLLPPPLLSRDLEATIPALAQSLIVFAGLGVIAWLSLRLRVERPFAGVLLAIFAFVTAWSLSVFAVQLP